MIDSIADIAPIAHLAPQQRARPFKVVKKIRRLAYQLNIPQHWRIHLVSIALLEPAPLGEDPDGRPQPEHPDLVYDKGIG
jgi:hypothetical protein